jgi:hypothetical protein
MSQVNIYASIEKRNFRTAFIYLLETQYNLLFSRRILNILAEDVEELLAEFYPKTERVSSGQLIWTCTGDDGQKAQPGKPAESYKTTTVVLPLIEPEDIQAQLEPLGKGKGKNRQQARHKRQIERMVKSAFEQGGLLTQAELSMILGLSSAAVRNYVREIETETGTPLPLKGYKMDQGSRPTHKGAAYETGFHTHVMKPNSRGAGRGEAREIVDRSNPKKAWPIKAEAGRRLTTHLSLRRARTVTMGSRTAVFVPLELFKNTCGVSIQLLKWPIFSY